MSGTVQNTGGKNENKQGTVPALKKTHSRENRDARCSNRDRNKSVGRTKVEIDNYTAVEPRIFHRRGTIKVALEDTHVVEKAEGQKEMQDRHSKEAAQHLQRRTSGSQPFMFKVIMGGRGCLKLQLLVLTLRFWFCWSNTEIRSLDL